MISAFLPVLPAILLEAFFYLAPAFEGFRRRALRLPIPLLALISFLSALFPVYLLNAAQGIYRPESFPLLAASAAIVCLWYFLVPRTTLADILLLALLAAFILSPWFKDLFPSPRPKPELTALAKLLWLRLGIWVMLFVRRLQVPGFGLLPQRQDVAQAALATILFLVCFSPYIALSKTMHFQPPNISPYLLPLYIPAVFLGVYIGIAYGEEFFFRGIIQHALTKDWRSPIPATLITSLLFGAVHLPFRNQFPNWRFAVLSAAASLFYGFAFHRAQSLRAAMLTHAAVVTFWMVAFSRSL